MVPETLGVNQAQLCTRLITNGGDTCHVNRGWGHRRENLANLGLGLLAIGL